MKHLLFLFALLPFLAMGQNITVKDLSGYLSSSKKDTIGYQFILEETKTDSVHTKVTAVIDIYNPKFREVLKDKPGLVYSPDGYVFKEAELWSYLKFRFQTYRSKGSLKPLQGYIRAVPVTVDLKPSGTLEDFLSYLRSKKTF